MASDLRKFVNPKFLRTVSLELFRELFEREAPGADPSDSTIFDLPEPEARAALTKLFEGPEDALPSGLVADLHHVAELGTEAGMVLLQERAARLKVTISAPADDGTDDAIPLDPKHFALLAYLRYPKVFDAASDLAALQARSSFAEYVGRDESVEPVLAGLAKDAFEAAAGEMFKRDHRGAHCRVGWYEDGDTLRAVVTHGAPVSVLPVVGRGGEEVIRFRRLEYAVLSYQVSTGRLGIAGLRKALRADLAEFFARHILQRPGFFAGEDCQDLYTLERIERTGLGFGVDHAFDPGIQRVEIIEVQLDRLDSETRDGHPIVLATHVTRSFSGSALMRVQQYTDRVAFGPGRYRIGHVVLRIHFAGRKRATSVTVKIKPPSLAVFKRHRFEARIMELLRRNGFCLERQPGEAAAAA
ncbi:hypothetical protein GXW77_14035 [Roseomonas alkaliterrae]|uniref:Uncharacterized protein n=1 Tax=Neoroseomonas alkaliterrae TaxID=1452450 RepID=A0A840YCN3_9PROT|nr:hypothetical protein [Neoroseomonas alkaliterrae]MBB5691703.1 hypothetical protein [Neoroseomonas alkaliterrae]MBR0677296.1 hypothetical protein [Neoroseomonas alkaliterrae]